MTDGQLLKDFLVRNDISVNDFAEDIGKSVRQVYQYFNSDTMNDRTVLMLCKYLKVPYGRDNMINKLKGDVGSAITKELHGEAVPYNFSKYLREMQSIEFEVVGNSMIPTINPGDIIFTQEIDPKALRETNYPFLGSAHVVVFGKQSMVKRIDNIVDGKVMLSSDNPHFTSASYPIKDIAELYRVFKHIGKESGFKIAFVRDMLK